MTKRERTAIVAAVVAAAVVAIPLGIYLTETMIWHTWAEAAPHLAGAFTVIVLAAIVIEWELRLALTRREKRWH